jgi:hypothetical protein
MVDSNQEEGKDITRCYRKGIGLQAGSQYIPMGSSGTPQSHHSFACLDSSANDSLGSEDILLLLFAWSGYVTTSTHMLCV